MKKTVIIVTAMVSLVVAAVPLHAQNTSFLKSAPVAYLNDEDVEILLSTLQAAMNEQADGETVTWTNSNTGHSGVISITNTHPDYDTTCRQVEMANQAAGRTGRGTFRMCKADDGKWKFAPSRQAQ
jgi:surface antigen